LAEQLLDLLRGLGKAVINCQQAASPGQTGANLLTIERLLPQTRFKLAQKKKLKKMLKNKASATLVFTKA